jgi:outer membrane lipoprotein-sorting protein
MMKILILITSLLLFCSPVWADRFGQIKDKFATTPCVSIEFLSILQSSVFNSVDTLHGSAYLSRDGRYLVAVGSDVYLADNRKQYSYSPTNNQVVVQTIDSGAAGAGELFYITRLDEFYKTTILVPDQTYKLTRKRTGTSSLPDSMTVFIDHDKGRIAKIEYFDANDERVTIVLSRESFSSDCDEHRFVPQFPDSVQTIKL